MKLIWIGEERILPGLGTFKKGDKLNIPEGVAKNLIKQGLAIAGKTKGGKK